MNGFARLPISLALCAATAAAVSDIPFPWDTNNGTTTPAPLEKMAFEDGIATAWGFDALTNAGDCYNNSKSGTGDLWDAMKDYEHGGYVKKAEALAKFSFGVHNVVDALSTCGESLSEASKFKKLMRYITDPRYYTVHNALTLSLNVAQDHNLLKGFADAWRKGDYRTAGLEIGDTVLDVISHPGIPETNSSEAVQITHGIIKGFASDVPIECLKDAHVEVASIIAGIVDVSSGVGLLEGLKSIVHALEGAVPAIQKCASEKERIMQLVHEMGSMKHPKDLAMKMLENLKKNGVDISLAAAGAVLAYKGLEWDRFGFEVGKILGASLPPVSTVIV